MRLATIGDAASSRCGLLVGDYVVNAVEAAREAQLGADEGWSSTRQVLAQSQEQRDRLARTAAKLADSGQGKLVTEVRLGPPVPDPEKIICLGLNYRAHAEEFGQEVNEMPIVFAKFRNALAGPKSSIMLPELSSEIDFEGELAVVIGTHTRNVPASRALDCVGGYMAMNDVTARDLQFRTSQWLPGKTLDTFAPCGPALVTPDEVGDVADLTLVTRLNGQVMQEANTSMMISPVAETIAFLSQLTTLVPGDIISTGTPEGVGFRREPPVFLAPGDTVEVEIDRVGCLTNDVVAAEPAASLPVFEAGERG